MEEQRTYSLDELIELTGYDRRTIAYYVQQGLLPRVGRRGPRTRYAQGFLDRLRYIRRVRDMQDTGIMRAVTLAEIRVAFDDKTDLQIRKVASGNEAPRWMAEAGGESEPAMSEATARLIGPGERAERAAGRQADRADPAQVKQLMTDLERRAIEGQQQQTQISAQRWTQVPITDNINLAVKGLRDKDLELAAALGRAIASLGKGV